MRCTELTLTPGRLGHRAPVQCVVSLGGSLQRQRDDAFGDRGTERRDARGPRLVAQKPVDALSEKHSDYNNNEKQLAEDPVKYFIYR